MKVSTLSVFALAGAVMAQEMGVNIVHSAKMQELMGIKQKHHDAAESAGRFDAGRYKPCSATKCVDGKAGEFACNNVDMLAFISHQDMGSITREGNDLWGSSKQLPHGNGIETCC